MNGYCGGSDGNGKHSNGSNVSFDTRASNGSHENVKSSGNNNDNHDDDNDDNDIN